MSGKGLLIAVYGPDGVGKSRQAGLLEERLREQQVIAKRIRYPVYDLKPTGPRLDEILHHRRERLEEEEMQKLFAQNRRDFDPTLRSWIDSGVTVVAENYKGTGIVWGTLRGISVDKMEKMNGGFLDSDVGILLDGPKREEMEGHPYGDDEEWYKARKVYLQMADKYGWVRVGADAPVLTVANRVWAVVRPVLAAR